ncbi:hypothetical protein VOLCADRAFT_90575 [Volvox carteri f. nagariensis]|uniref:Uncharacterized protein n=1 Tax=Volvox carteri f. nagariensis TaxID=3068 RepID=D8TUS2_VOLCA|nr:uncharacterized protein VOLCADRAFT_90575 [Volvox carteri f. nagariensis]EFJ48757.1 hypothetical protein VOLCADRAFT_90575 [Volvox carteri f. nagariensis]|eukprot:XP_002950089.1 hypothetical protein VOLCADRAFT_90575 [Volvox carteri f. nagariensis]
MEALDLHLELFAFGAATCVLCRTIVLTLPAYSNTFNVPVSLVYKRQARPGWRPGGDWAVHSERQTHSCTAITARPKAPLGYRCALGMSPGQPRWPGSKTDQEGKGQTIRIARVGGVACPRRGHQARNLPHSMRIGGNSAAAARGVSEEARKVAGRRTQCKPYCFLRTTYPQLQVALSCIPAAAAAAHRNLILRRSRPGSELYDPWVIPISPQLGRPRHQLAKATSPSPHPLPASPTPPSCY